MNILKWIGIVTGSLILIAVAAALILLGPRNLIGMIRYDQREKGKLVPGNEVPDVEVVALDGATREHVRQWVGGKPLVLIFGSFT